MARGSIWRLPLRILRGAACPVNGPGVPVSRAGRTIVVSRNAGTMSKTILVTGAAGFIGSHTVQALAARGDRVVGLDNLNDYYDPARKQANIREVQHALRQHDQGALFTFIEGDIRNQRTIADIFAARAFDGIIHLAAMAGVRRSIEQPQLYSEVNVTGTLNMLEAAVGRGGLPSPRAPLPTFIFASTSSVYGATTHRPFQEQDPCNQPLAPYAASKKAGELLGYSYHHLYGLPFTALRLFTVYGPRGRPDMMACKVLDNIFFNREVPLYRAGQLHRDWTFVEDIVQGVVKAVDRPLGYEVVNLGRGAPVLLAEFITVLEACVGRKARLVPAPMMEADMAATHADMTKARALLGYHPQVAVPEGISRLWTWYKKSVLNM